MKIKSAEFIKSDFKKEQFINDDLPQIAFAGRSNCGKSTLINVLLNRKKLVKTSSKPGFTKSVNYFLINGEFYLVDLPGFGFAKISKKEKLEWDRLITDFLKYSVHLRGVVHLVDIRRLITPKDVFLINFLSEIEIPYLIVLTKSDKLSKNEINKSLRKLKNDYNLQNPILTSSLKRLGMELLWDEIKVVLNIE